MRHLTYKLLPKVADDIINARFLCFNESLHYYKDLEASKEIYDYDSFHLPFYVDDKLAGYTRLTPCPYNYMNLTNIENIQIPNVQSCPMEIKRILTKGAYQQTKSDRSQLSLQIPDFSEKPQWWDPNDLGDTILVFTYHHPDSDRIQRLFSNSDSTRFYFCDLVY